MTEYAGEGRGVEFPAEDGTRLRGRLFVPAAVTIRSVEQMLTFEPAGWFAHIAPTPLLMIVERADTCTFPRSQLDAYRLLNGPKRLVVHDGGHFDTYTDHFDTTAGAA